MTTTMEAVVAEDLEVVTEEAVATVVVAVSPIPLSSKK